MKKISSIILGALIFSFASSANAALMVCTPPPYPSTAANQQQYNDCLKQSQLQKQATTSQVVAPTQSVQQTKQSGLTESQIQAIVMLLQAFGADQAVVVKIEDALRGRSVR